MKSLSYILLLLYGVKGDEGTCEINACEALEQSQMNLREFADNLEENNTNNYLVKLERRLRSLEQPGKRKISNIN